MENPFLYIFDGRINIDIYYISFSLLFYFRYTPCYFYIISNMYSNWHNFNWGIVFNLATCRMTGSGHVITKTKTTNRETILLLLACQELINYTIARSPFHLNFLCVCTTVASVSWYSFLFVQLMLLCTDDFAFTWTLIGFINVVDFFLLCKNKLPKGIALITYEK
jgi:hypothetical protein